MVKSPRWSAVKENKEAPHWVCCTVSIPWQAGENSIYVNELWRHTDAPLSQASLGHLLKGANGCFQSHSKPFLFSWSQHAIHAHKLLFIFESWHLFYHNWWPRKRKEQNLFCLDSSHFCLPSIGWFGPLWDPCQGPPSWINWWMSLSSVLPNCCEDEPPLRTVR